MELGALMHPLSIYGVFDNVSRWRKKTVDWYRNVCDSTVLSSNLAQPVGSQIVKSTVVSTGTQTSVIHSTLSDMADAEDMMADNSEVLAVATGIEKPAPSGRKGRVRKAAGTPRVAGVKKPKIVKPPRNPFRRSDTGKLQLKRLQMGKRVETMNPRIEVLRERLETMEGRRTFISGKLKLVVEELEARSSFVVEPVSVDDTCAEGVTGGVGDILGVDEDIELDDEVGAITDEVGAITDMI
jgi:hypothetical protein